MWKNNKSLEDFPFEFRKYQRQYLSNIDKYCSSSPAECIFINSSSLYSESEIIRVRLR